MSMPEVRTEELTARCAQVRTKANLLELAFSWMVASGQRSALPFGAETHKFHLRRPLADEKIRHFETVNGVTLPEAYSTFLKHVGNGGAGPDGGLVPLRWRYRYPPPGHLAQSFPFVYGQANESRARAKPPSDRYPGALPLCEIGCDCCHWLVVSGPSRGLVFSSHDSEDPPRGAPVQFAPEPDFLAWYEAWQDRMIAQMGAARAGVSPTADHSRACGWIPRAAERALVAKARAYSLYVRARTLAFGLAALLLPLGFAIRHFHAGRNAAASWAIDCGFVLLLAAFFGTPKRLLRWIGRKTGFAGVTEVASPHQQPVLGGWLKLLFLPFMLLGTATGAFVCDTAGGQRFSLLDILSVAGVNVLAVLFVIWLTRSRALGWPRWAWVVFPTLSYLVGYLGIVLVLRPELIL